VFCLSCEVSRGAHIECREKFRADARTRDYSLTSLVVMQMK
jgi:hypothetical protein